MRARDAFAFHGVAKIISKSIIAAEISQSRKGTGVNRHQFTTAAAGRAVVVNVAVAVFTFDPSSVTDCGETEHVDACGVPVQVHVTVCLDPPCGAAETEKFAVSPAVTVRLEGAAETV